MSKHRTGEDFNKWFNEHGGDPWGYDSSKVVQNRLKLSYEFVEKKLGKNFSGNFIELGAFDGSFTLILAKAFPKASIYGNDISSIAIEKIKSRCQNYSTVSVNLKDLLNIKRSDFQLNSKESVILLLECLYYLQMDERVLAIKNIYAQFPSSRIIISTPIVGGLYFTEKELINMFTSVGYQLAGFSVVSFRRYNFGFRARVSSLLSTSSSKLRHLLANQVIYLFNPINGSRT